MDHSKLHKPNSMRWNAADNKLEKGKRRSIVQKQNRGILLEKQRDLSPLQEKTNIPELKKKTGDMKSRLEIWKRERDRKNVKKSKPIFKVSSSIKRNDKLFVPSKATSSKPATGNQVTRAKNARPQQPQAKKKSERPVARTTRSKTFASKIPEKIKEAKPIKEEKDERRTTRSSSKDHLPVLNKEINMHIRKSEQSPVQEMKATEETSKPSSPTIITRINSDNDPLSEESFAPTNFCFKAPAGLQKFAFSSKLPNSNESFIYSSQKGSMNFISSTPLAPVPAVRNGATPVPMIFSSASGSSSDENNTEQPTMVAKQRENPINNEKDETLQYFRNLVITETSNLSTHCEEWGKIQENIKDILTEEVNGEICTVIGQAQLLMAERFHQFSQLVDKYEKPSPDHNPVNPTDLKGFWEMIYYQVDDVVNKFKNLKELKENNWEKPEVIKKMVTRKRKAKVAKCSSAHKKAARKRIKEAREAMRAKLQEKENDDNDTEEPPAQSSKPSTSTSVATKSTEEISSQEDESMPITRLTRSRRKTPGGKNVSFATPRSKKRTHFNLDSSDDERNNTPTSQPRKRVMRKTPLPGPRPDSTLKEEENSSEDVRASPSFKTINNMQESDVDDNDQGEIKGLKLNFDDIVSDNEEIEETDIDMKYLISSSESDSLTSPLVKVSAMKETCMDSPGRILRNKRKSYHNPISPFLKAKNKESEVFASVNDLMSFSPLLSTKDSATTSEK